MMKFADYVGVSFTWLITMRFSSNTIPKSPTSGEGFSIAVYLDVTMKTSCDYYIFDSWGQSF